MSISEDHGTDAYHGRSFFNGYRIVSGHPHGDFTAISIDISAFSNPILKHIRDLLQTAEILPDDSLVISVCGHAHHTGNVDIRVFLLSTDYVLDLCL